MEEQLLQLLNGRSLAKGNSDIWKWKEDGEGVFTVRSAYNKLQGTFEGGDNKLFETLWKTRVTSKAQILGWRMFLDKLPIKAKLIANYSIVFVSYV